MKIVKMYLLKREDREDDYICVMDKNIFVVSAMMKHIWTDPNKIDFENASFPYTLETYYGDNKVLENAVLLWEHTVV